MPVVSTTTETSTTNVLHFTNAELVAALAAADMIPVPDGDSPNDNIRVNVKRFLENQAPSTVTTLDANTGIEVILTDFTTA